MDVKKYELLVQQLKSHPQENIFDFVAREDFLLLHCAIARCLLESYFEKFTYIHVQYKYIEYFSSKEYISYEAMESITLSQLEDRFCKILKYYERKKT